MLRIGQVEATATQDGKYTDGSVAGGIAATRLRAAAFNAMQEELAHIVESAGLALDINDMTQVLKAIQKLTLSRANPFADIKSDGEAAISTALTNLRLERFDQDTNETRIWSPDKRSYLLVQNRVWGMYSINDPEGSIPIGLGFGGTGAKDAPGARTNLELGNSATRNVGTTENTVAAGDDSRIVNAVQRSEFTSGEGWVRFPDGTIIQWGTAYVGPLARPTAISFPIPFTKMGYKVTTSFDQAAGISNDCPAFAVSPKALNWADFMSSRTNGVTAGCHWIAIGR